MQQIAETLVASNSDVGNSSLSDANIELYKLGFPDCDYCGGPALYRQESTHPDGYSLRKIELCRACMNDLYYMFKEELDKF